MPYISKKLVRLVVMDALDEVIKGNVEKRLSKDTQLTIIEAVEAIAEAIQQDLQRDGHPRRQGSSRVKKKVKVAGKRLPGKSVDK